MDCMYGVLHASKWEYGYTCLAYTHAHPGSSRGIAAYEPFEVKGPISHIGCWFYVERHGIWNGLSCTEIVCRARVCLEVCMIYSIAHDVVVAVVRRACSVRGDSVGLGTLRFNCWHTRRVDVLAHTGCRRGVGFTHDEGAGCLIFSSAIVSQINVANTRKMICLLLVELTNFLFAALFWPQRSCRVNVQNTFANLQLSTEC